MQEMLALMVSPLYGGAAKAVARGGKLEHAPERAKADSDEAVHDEL